MTKTDLFSRRKALLRLGAIAATAYAVPTIGTISTAQARRGSSGGGSGGGGSSTSGSSTSGSSTSGSSTSGSDSSSRQRRRRNRRSS